MGGVDLCDMLLALYRITVGTKKWYMHIVYHCIGLCIVNSWLCYRCHCEQKGVPKKDVLSLLHFQTRIANGLVFSNKSTETPTRAVVDLKGDDMMVMCRLQQKGTRGQNLLLLQRSVEMLLVIFQFSRKRKAGVRTAKVDFQELSVANVM